MTVLNVETLFNLSDQRLRGKVVNEFETQMKNSNSVKSTFFGETLPSYRPLDAEYVNKMAIAYVCEAISQTTIHDFNQTIEKDKLDTFVKSALTDSKAIDEGQNLYKMLFASFCKDEATSTCFQDFINDGIEKWRDQLFQHLTDTGFITNELSQFHTRPGWIDLINLTMFKYRQLNPTEEQVQTVIKTWRSRLHDDTITESWQQTNFTPFQTFIQSVANILGVIGVACDAKSQVTAQLNKYSVIENYDWQVIFGNYSDVYVYGGDVTLFLHEKANPLGFANQKSPTNTIVGHNAVVDKVGDAMENYGRAEAAKGEAYTHPFGCFIAGTPILLKDGTTFSIEQLTARLEIASRDNHSTYTSDERIIIEVDIPTLIYGFDDGQTQDRPFFSGGHMFHTSEGWKAIAPETAHRENPHVNVGQLSQGDIVYRVKSHNPFEYEQVEIKGFTVDNLPVGSYLYSVHLIDGLQYYHANGYLVSANYPQMTEWRMRHNFAKLSYQERIFLRTRMEEIMPTLKHAIGPFIQEPILRALNQHTLNGD